MSKTFSSVLFLSTEATNALTCLQLKGLQSLDCVPRATYDKAKYENSLYYDLSFKGMPCIRSRSILLRALKPSASGEYTKNNIFFCLNPTFEFL